MVSYVVLELVPNICQSNLPTIASKVADDILSGSASYDAVPPRAEVSSLVRARMRMIKDMIKEGKGVRKPPVLPVSSVAGGSSISPGMVPTKMEIKANLQHRIPILLPELIPELVSRNSYKMCECVTLQGQPHLHMSALISGIYREQG